MTLVIYPLKRIHSGLTVPLKKGNGLIIGERSGLVTFNQRYDLCIFHIFGLLLTTGEIKRIPRERHFFNKNIIAGKEGDLPCFAGGLLSPIRTPHTNVFLLQKY